MKSKERRVFIHGLLLHKVTGMWLVNDEPLNRFNKVKSYIFVATIIGNSIFQFTALKKLSEFDSKLECVIECITVFIGVCKILPVMYNRNNILQLIKDTIKLSESLIDNDVEMEICNRWQKYQDELIKFCVRSYTAVISIMYVIVPMLKHNAFPFEGVLPNILFKSPWYYIVFAFETVVLYMIMIAMLSSDAFSITFLCQLCKELETIRYSVERLGKSKDVSLVKIIQRHAIAMDYGSRICNNLSTMFLLQHLTYSTIICLSGIVMLTTKDSIVLLKMVMFITILGFTLLIICLVGEIVISASLGIAETIESNSNYEIFLRDVASLKMISFVLARAQNPLRMKVGCFGSMNLRFYSETMNKIVSFFMILKSLME